MIILQKYMSPGLGYFNENILLYFIMYVARHTNTQNIFYFI
jgi:hypothetical protein